MCVSVSVTHRLLCLFAVGPAGGGCCQREERHGAETLHHPAKGVQTLAQYGLIKNKRKLLLEHYSLDTVSTTETRALSQCVFSIRHISYVQ